VARSACHRRRPQRRPASILLAGLDLSRKRLDYCLLGEDGERVEVGAAPPDGDGLVSFARRVERDHGSVQVRAAIESMNGARFVHDTLERGGWEIEVADAQKVKGLAPLACKTDKSTPGCSDTRSPPRSALSAQQAPSRQAARSQGRPGRHRPPPGPGDLAHAHPKPSLRSAGAARALAARRPLLRCATGAMPQ
jgi:hypothetical protein